MKTIVRGMLIFISIVFSGYTLFETTTGKQGCYNEGVSVLPSENGGWLVSGAYNCDGGPSQWRSCLVALNAEGDTLSSTYDLPYNGIMKSTPDGNLIFAGGNHAGFTYDTAKVFKVTRSGELLWEKSLFEGYCHHLLTDILAMENGFLIVGNYAQASCSSPVYDCYVAKLDLNGALVWKYDVTDAGNDQLHVVRQMQDGNLAAFGWTENKSSMDDADYLLIKLDSNGNEIWSKKFGDDTDNYGYGMDITRDNGFILNGHSSTMDIMGLDTDGGLIWSKHLAEVCGGRYFKAYATMDAGYVFLGMEKSSSSQCQSALIKTNSEGEIFWKKNYPGVLRQVEESSPGHFALTGYKAYLPKLYVVGFDTTVFTKNEDADEIQTFDLNAHPFFSNEEKIEEPLTSTRPINAQSVKPVVYPNPSENIVNIEFENAGHQVYRLEVFDANGKLIMKESTNSGRFTVTRKMVATGIYTYQLIGAGSVFNGKFLFQ